MDDLFFGRFFRAWPPLLAGEARAWAPSVDMIDRKEELLVRADLPGFEQMLTIRGEPSRRGSEAWRHDCNPLPTET